MARIQFDYAALTKPTLGIGDLSGDPILTVIYSRKDILLAKSGRD